MWKKRSVRISFALCVLYIVVFGSFLTYQWFNFGSQGGSMSGFGQNFDGYDNIRKSQAYAEQWKGDLTDETFQGMIADIQRLYNASEAAQQAGDEEKALQFSREESRTERSTFVGWISSLYPELEDPAQKYPWMTAWYVEPSKLTGFYERRQQCLETSLDVFGHSEEEKAYLLEMNARVEEPFAYSWVGGWSMLLGNMLPDFGVVIAVFIVISLSTVFSGEWQNRTGMLMLTTKNGWMEIACVKILSGLAFALELFAVTAAGAIAGQLFHLGTEGWDLPIQYIKLIAVAPMNMLQAELYEYAYTLLGTIGLAAFVMFFSAVARNNFTSLIGGLAVVYLPMAVREYVPMWLEKLLDLLPLAGSSADIFRTNVFHVFGRIVWSPYLLVTVPVLLGCLLLPFTVRRWARKLRE